MSSTQDLVWDIWQSHHKSYLGKKSLAPVPDDVPAMMAKLFTPGPSYFYVIDSPTLDFDYVSESIRDVLGLDPATVSLHSLLGQIHPDDQEFFLRCEDIVAHFITKQIPVSSITNYKISYCLRERTNTGDYRLFLLQTVTLRTTEEGALLKVFGLHSDISHITTENNHRMSLIGLNGEPSYLGIDPFNPEPFQNFTPYNFPKPKGLFTKREKEVVNLLARGLTTDQIAAELNISPQTVLTHRKKILRKAGVSNTAALIAECVRQGHI
jgi:DNA-binding CsgD family transcriptional regulator